MGGRQVFKYYPRRHQVASAHRTLGSIAFEDCLDGSGPLQLPISVWWRRGASRAIPGVDGGCAWCVHAPLHFHRRRRGRILATSTSMRMANIQLDGMLTMR